jgi:SAM-dependent methyltransferase
MFGEPPEVDAGVGVIERGVRWLLRFQSWPVGSVRRCPGLRSAFPAHVRVVVRALGQDGHVAVARYDGHADWYDATFGFLGAETGSGGLLGRLLGSAGQADRVCLDVGCGTGLHFRAVQVRGYTVIGVDVSADQLRVAASRNRRLVRADAGRLPLRDASVAAVAMTFLHTDVDHFPATLGEAARVLSPGGRLVYLGVHPAYVGAFLDRTAEIETQEVRVTGGYGDERLRRDPTGRFPIRSRVGARNLTLATLLNAFLAQDTLRLTSIAEFDTDLQPWRPGAGDRRILPWNVAITARAVIQQHTDRSTDSPADLQGASTARQERTSDVIVARGLV